MRKYEICRSWEYDSKLGEITRKTEIIPTAEDIILPTWLKAIAGLGAVGALVYISASYPDEFQEFTDQFYSTPWYIITAVLGVFAVLLICFVIWGIIREEKAHQQEREGASK